eukprot:CAMPEP_0172491286 /NCGR_PEP_ID=MMETSP1066-20121228/22034_1 /TAXON_ID=671091 /ORGANISM="Coscinodiscus wailesii, Strain CCMP2513" /LENGTH=273 /DNA_ID=CAMNT_0013260251 /DNA_START=99 /DNA_END=920 /DNA_ORIENTATION=+
MIVRASLIIGTLLVSLNTCTAQFGVPGKVKQKTFEEANNEATEKFAGMDIGAGGDMAQALGDLGNFDMGQWSEMLSEMMNDPEAMKQFEGMKDVMADIANTPPEELIKNAVDMLSSGSLFDNLNDNMDDVITNLETTGMVPKEKLEEYKTNPEKLKEDINEAMGALGDVFKDPETVASAAKVIEGMQEAYKNPEIMMEQINKIAAEFSNALETELNDDDKIEQARLQLLENPDLVPSLSAVFSTDEMKEILADPVKWRESVKKGQGLLSQATE